MSAPDNGGGAVFHPDGLPPRRRRKVPIWSVIPNHTNVLHPIQDRIVKVATHWIQEERRSILCPGPASGCQRCADQPTWRWTGYLLAYLEPIRWWENGEEKNAKGAVILHVTEHAALSCPEMASEEQELTRYKIRAVRAGTTKRSPVSMTLEANHVPKFSKSDFDTLGYLLDMYKSPNNEERRRKQRGDDS